MATIGEQLLQPESGWKRYDDRNENISYVGNWVKGSYSSTQYYLGTDTYIDIGIASSKNSHTISFNFIGSKIRIMGLKNTTGAENCFINIDNIEYNFSQNTSTLTQGCLNFELLNLTNKEHYVQMYSNNSNASKYGIVFDSIDIDENGELKPYDPSISSSKKYANNIIPVMTSDENDEVKISCSAYYIGNNGFRNYGFLAFDNTVNTGWNFENQSQPIGGHWLKIFLKIKQDVYLK